MYYILLNALRSAIGQDKAVHLIASVFYAHYVSCFSGESNLPRTNIMLCGNSGCGKTYIARKAAEVLGLNVIVVDCSMLTQQGYRGLNLSQAIYNSWKNCDYLNRKNFRYSVIILDEFDKIVDNLTREARGNPIFDFLPLLDGRYKLDLSEFRETGYVDLSECMVILTGACYGMKRKKAEIINKNKNIIGFRRKETNDIADFRENSESITEKDMIDYGVPTEILGRISQIININPLSRSDLAKIICCSEDSVFNKYKRFFAMHDIRLRITAAAKNAVAEIAIHKETGARALNAVIEALLLPEIATMFENKNIDEMVISYNKYKGIYIRYKYFETQKDKWIEKRDIAV